MKSPRTLIALHAALFAFAVPVLVTGTASAETEACDKECPKGFECQTVATPCPDIACVGDDCPVCEGTEAICVPQPCATNSDCAADMVCHTETRLSCDEAPPCARDDGGDPECEPAPPSNCTEETVSQCVPRWYLPCESASDCGPGFTCEEQLQGGCPGSMGSGGSEGDSAGEGSTPASPGMPAPDGGAGDGEDSKANPIPPSDGEADARAPDDGCVFEPSGEFACVRIETGCEDDSDCLAGWTCGANNEGSCWSSSDGTSGCDPVDPPKVCYPPYENLGGRGIAEDDSGSNAGGGEPDVGTPVPGTDPGAEPPKGQEPAGEASGDNDDNDKVVTANTGCSMGAQRATGTGLGAIGLGLLGLLIARRKR